MGRRPFPTFESSPASHEDGCPVAPHRCSHPGLGSRVSADLSIPFFVTAFLHGVQRGINSSPTSILSSPHDPMRKARLLGDGGGGTVSQGASLMKERPEQFETETTTAPAHQRQQSPSPGRAPFRPTVSIQPAPLEPTPERLSNKDIQTVLLLMLNSLPFICFVQSNSGWGREVQTCSREL